MNMIKKYNEYVNEDLNFSTYENGLVRFEERYFYYDAEDDIIYGSSEKPINISTFWFNPIEEIYCISGKESKCKETGNACFIIEYDMNNGESICHEDDIQDYMESLGVDTTIFDIDDPEEFFTNMSIRKNIRDAFERVQDNVRHILVWGDQMIATTFDVIEEND